MCTEHLKMLVHSYFTDEEAAVLVVQYTIHSE